MMDNTHHVKLQGDLTHDTVEGVLAKTVPLLPHNAPVHIDLSQTTRCDSASLALLLALLKKGQAQDCQITYQSPPEALYKLAQVSGITKLLGF